MNATTKVSVTNCARTCSLGTHVIVFRDTAWPLTIKPVSPTSVGQTQAHIMADSRNLGCSGIRFFCPATFECYLTSLDGLKTDFHCKKYSFLVLAGNVGFEKLFRQGCTRVPYPIWLRGRVHISVTSFGHFKFSYFY